MKSFIAALGGFIQCMLYPYSEVVLSATTIKTAKKMVKNKMENELCNKFSKKLKWLKDNGFITFTYNQEDIRVDFKFNGSWILILPETDSSRGERSNFLILEEVRLMKQHMVDSVFMPMRHARVSEFRLKEEYKDDKRLVENAKIIYLTSTRYKYEWFWKRWVGIVEEHFNNERIKYGIIAGDVMTAMYHNLLTEEDFEIAKKDSSEAEVAMEYYNEPIGEVEGAYYELEEFKRNSIILKGFIPPTYEEYILEKNNVEKSWMRHKKDEEIRVIYVDFAFSDGTKGEDNDNTVIGCMSGFPNEVGDLMLKNGDYMETMSGGKKDETIKRIRELFYYYQADVLICDMRNGGEDRWTDLSKPYYHEELGFEMRGFGIYEDNTILEGFCSSAKADALRSKVVDLNSIPVTIPVIGDPERNNNFHIQMKNSLRNNTIRFLMDEIGVKKELEENVEFLTMNVQQHARRLLGHIQFSLTAQEAIKLKKEVKKGFLALVEAKRTDTKDRIIATEYANYFFYLKELQLLKDKQEQDINLDEWRLIF